MNEIIKTYVNDNRVWFKFVLQWFFVAMLLGAVTFFFRPELLNQILELFRDKFGPNPEPNLNLAKEIFLQNSTACLIALIGGIFFGITSFLIILFNGFIL